MKPQCGSPGHSSRQSGIYTSLFLGGKQGGQWVSLRRHFMPWWLLEKKAFTWAVYTHTIQEYSKSLWEKSVEEEKYYCAMVYYTKYCVCVCVCSILLLKGSTPDINNSSSHTLGALYHVVVVALPLLIRLELLTHTMGLFGFIASDWYPISFFINIYRQQTTTNQTLCI